MRPQGLRPGTRAPTCLPRASNRKVAKPWFDSRCGSASLCPWERYLMLFLTLGAISLPVVVAQPDDKCWSGMIDTNKEKLMSNNQSSIIISNILSIICG